MELTAWAHGGREPLADPSGAPRSQEPSSGGCSKDPLPTPAPSVEISPRSLLSSQGSEAPDLEAAMPTLPVAEMTTSCKLLSVGRCVRSPRGYLVFTWTCVVAPSAFFFSWPAGYLKEELGVAFVFATAALLVLTIILLLLTAYINPGVIPRPKIQQAVPGPEERMSTTAGTPPFRVDPSRAGSSAPSRRSSCAMVTGGAWPATIAGRLARRTASTATSASWGTTTTARSSTIASGKATTPTS